MELLPPVVPQERHGRWRSTRPPTFSRQAQHPQVLSHRTCNSFCHYFQALGNSAVLLAMFMPSEINLFVYWFWGLRTFKCFSYHVQALGNSVVLFSMFTPLDMQQILFFCDFEAFVNSQFFLACSGHWPLKSTSFLNEEYNFSTLICWFYVMCCFVAVLQQQLSCIKT